MSSKKKGQVPRKAPPAPPTKKSGGSKIPWVVGALVVFGLVLGASALWKSAPKGEAAASPEEQKYIGRLLPAGYEEPKVAEFAAYSSEVPMTDVVATDEGGSVSISAKALADKKIVYFEYAKPGSKAIPLLAYVKPSGKVFVGVSYCPPCQGERQSIGADGTLTCASCGTKRNLETGVGISGACKLYPVDELPVQLSGDKILLEKSAIDGWTPQPLDRKVG